MRVGGGGRAGGEGGALAELEARNRTFFEQAMLDAAAPAVVYQINVTNTGAVAAADAVLGFLTPPGAGVDGVPLKALFGFERVRLQPGESKSVYLYPELSQFAQVGLSGKRAVLAGEYIVSFGVAETARHGQGFASQRLATV
jgi:hypothetical protein